MSLALHCISGILVLCVQCTKIGFYLSGRVAPVLYCNVQTINLIATGVFLRESLSSRVLLLLLVIALDLFYLIHESLVIGELGETSLATIMFRGITLEFPVDSLNNPFLVSESIAILLQLAILLLCIKCPKLETDIPLPVFAYVSLVCISSLILWLLPPAFLLYSDAHLFTVWLAWIFLPMLGPKLSAKDRLYFVGAAFIALLLEISFLIIYVTKAPSTFTFQALTNFRYGDVTYSIPYYHVSLFLNYAAHIVDCLGILVVFILILNQ